MSISLNYTHHLHCSSSMYTSPTYPFTHSHHITLTLTYVFSIFIFQNLISILIFIFSFSTFHIQLSIHNPISTNPNIVFSIFKFELSFSNLHLTNSNYSIPYHTCLTLHYIHRELIHASLLMH